MSPLCRRPFTGTSLYLLATLFVTGTLLTGGAQAQEDEWKLVRVEAVISDGQFNTLQELTGLDMPTGSFVVESQSDSDVTWSSSTTVSYAFPATVPGELGATRNGTVTVAVKITDPRDPAQDPKPSEILFQATIRDGLRSCPIPPNPVTFKPLHNPYGFGSIIPNLLAASDTQRVQGGGHNFTAQATAAFLSDRFSIYNGANQIFYIGLYGSIPFGDGGDRLVWVYPVYERETVSEPPIEVTSLADEGDDGNYTTGHQTLREALERARNEPEEVTDVTIPIRVTGEIELTKGSLTIPDTGGRITIENATEGEVTLDAKRASGILEVPYGASVTISQVMFKNGKSEKGGAIWSEGLLELRECIFLNNALVFDDIPIENGGAIWSRGKAELWDCSFEQNSYGTAKKGGAIWSVGSLKLTGCIFINNSVREAGGAIWISSGGRQGPYFSARNCEFLDNFAFEGGGAIAAKKPVFGRLDLVIDQCGFNKNEAGKRGGAIWLNTDGEAFVALDMKDCSFEHNIAPYGGAIAIHQEIALPYTKFTRCTFWEHDIGAGGDCLYATGSQNITIENSLFVDSIRPIYAEFTKPMGSINLKHSTLIAPRRWFRIGPMLKASGLAEISLDHCMVSGPFTPNLLSDAGGNFTSQGYNLIEHPGTLAPHPSGSDITGVRPSFAHTSDGGLSLLAYSRGVNEGNQSPSSSFPETDLNGNPRIAGGRIDIGAIEVSADLVAALDFVKLSPLADNNFNGRSDLIDVLTGIDPTFQLAPNLPVRTNPGATAKAATIGMLMKDRGGANDASGTAVVEVRIDERASIIEGTVQTSPDLVVWTDRATYRPLGAGLGCERTGKNGSVSAGAEQSGYGWFIREEIPGVGDRLFARLMGRLLSDPGAPVITSPSTAEGITTGAFSYQIEAEGATSFTAEGLPEGLLLDETTGEISGTPTETGEFVVIITASNTEGANAIFDLTLSISPDTTQEGLVAWYRFDGDAQDASGQDNHGTLGEGDLAPQLTTDRDDQANSAYKFDGAAFIQLTDSLPIGSSDNTVAVWVNIPPPEELANIRVGIILGNYRDSPNSNWEIYSDGGTRLYWNNGQIDARRSEALWGTGWRHLAWVRDTNAGQFLVYIDGVAQDPITAPGKDVDFTGRIHRIGGDNRDTNGGPGFQGDLDDLRIYDRALTTVEIQALAGQ